MQPRPGRFPFRGRRRGGQGGLLWPRPRHSLGLTSSRGALIPPEGLDAHTSARYTGSKSSSHVIRWGGSQTSRRDHDRKDCHRACYCYDYGCYFEPGGFGSSAFRQRRNNLAAVRHSDPLQTLRRRSAIEAHVGRPPNSRSTPSYAKEKDHVRIVDDSVARYVNSHDVLDWALIGDWDLTPFGKDQLYTPKGTGAHSVEITTRDRRVFVKDLLGKEDGQPGAVLNSVEGIYTFSSVNVNSSGQTLAVGWCDPPSNSTTYTGTYSFTVSGGCWLVNISPGCKSGSCTANGTNGCTLTVTQGESSEQYYSDCGGDIKYKKCSWGDLEVCH